MAAASYLAATRQGCTLVVRVVCDWIALRGCAHFLLGEMYTKGVHIWEMRTSQGIGDISFPSPPHGSILHGGSSRHIRAAHGGPSSSSAVNSSWIGTANLRVAVHCFASARRSARRVAFASCGRVCTRPLLRVYQRLDGHAVESLCCVVLRVSFLSGRRSALRVANTSAH